MPEVGKTRKGAEVGKVWRAGPGRFNNLVGYLGELGFLLKRDGKPFKHLKQMMGII